MKRVMAGFSVISLLIATSIGVFLIAGVGKVYVDSKTAYNVRDAVSIASENARFAIDDLRRSLLMAGRGINADIDNRRNYEQRAAGLRTFPDVSANGDIGASSIVDIDNVDPNLGSSVIAIRHASGPTPCRGAGAVSAMTTVRFFVDADTDELVCEINGVTQVLVSGVIRMRVLYGVDTENFEGAVANQYLTASQLEVGRVEASHPFWNNVVAIRVGLIVSSAERELPLNHRLNVTETFNLLGTDFTMPDTRHFYKTVSTTISLRNLNTIVQRQ